MCGIAGGWWANPEDPVERLPRALRKIKHRGPDDDGYRLYSVGVAEVALGHTRLSIIDLSAAGHQPMHSTDGRFAIVFNGEIYNYRELRAQLKGMGHSFQSDSDTEVLLTAWAHWGVSCLERLVGMFAFAVLDKVHEKLICVRDAFGIKPFFYAAAQEVFSFASELPALLELLPNKPSLDWQRSYDYLVHGDYDSNASTFYEGVYRLEPGHWLQVDTRSGRIYEPKRWWSPASQERKDWSFGDAVEQVREQFLKSIRLHLRSDVPVGAALSGGIDSSAVVCAMRFVEPDLPIQTFSFIAAGSELNETHWIDRINSYVGATAHKVHMSAAELARDLDDMIRTQGEPFGGTSIYAQYRVYQLARTHGVTVTLDGQGADEALAGYDGYPGQRLRSLLETGQLYAAFEFWGNWSKWPGRSRMLAAKYLASEITDGFLYETLRLIDGKPTVPAWVNSGVLVDKGVALRKPRLRPETETRGRRVIDELGLSLSRRGLASLLRHGDRNSMRFSVESRVPFLTVDFVELLLSMPERYLISPAGETKHVFREAMRGIVPDDVLHRRDKVGFATPEHDLLLSLRGYIRQLLERDMNFPFLDQRKMIQALESKESDQRRFSAQIWRWINFFRWYDSQDTLKF